MGNLLVLKSKIVTTAWWPTVHCTALYGNLVAHSALHILSSVIDGVLDLTTKPETRDLAVPLLLLFYINYKAVFIGPPRASNTAS